MVLKERKRGVFCVCDSPSGTEYKGIMSMQEITVRATPTTDNFSSFFGFGTFAQKVYNIYVVVGLDKGHS